MAFELTKLENWQNREEWFFQREYTSTYESWYEGRYKKAEVLQKNIIADLVSEDDRVKDLLEFGCGTSRFTRWWQEIGITATGSDISPFMIGQAAQLFNGDLLLAHSAHMPYQDNTFDAVAFITTFEYYPDPVKVIREAARVGKYGIIFGMIHKITTATIRRRVQQVFGKNPYYTTAQFYTVNSLQKVIEEALQGEKYSIKWQCTGLPRWFLFDEWHVPYGDFLGLYVKREV